MSDSIAIQNSDGETFAEVIDIIGVSEVRKAFQQSVKEGSLHNWFKGSKSKDGKPGWVNVVTGGTCASDEKGEGTPKCVSASKRASMSKSERLSASKRKKKADPGQQGKSGAAKPTYVSTDKPKKKMKESYTVTNADKKGNTPAYQGYKAGKKNVKTGKPMYKAADHMKESHYGKSVNKIPAELDKAVSMHKSQAKRLRDSEEVKKDAGKAANAVPAQLDKAVALHTKQAKTLRKAGIKENILNWREEIKRDEYGDPIGGPKISKKQLKKNLTSNTPDEQHTTTTSEGYIDLPLEVEIPNSDSKFKLGLMFRESLEQDKGMLFIFEEVGQHSFYMKNTRIPLDIAFVKEDGTIESIKELTPYSYLPVSSDGEVLFAIEANRGWFIENNVEVGDEIALAEGDKKGKGSGSKDACYHKVKSRYSVWPSAYASGALVKCRKVGAANWGNKSESYEINPVAHKAAQKKSKIRNLAIGNTNPNEKAAAEKKAGGPKLVGEANVDMKNYLDKKAKMLTKKRNAQSDAAKNNPHFDSTQPSPSGRNKYEEVELGEGQKCWKGYEKKGTKKMFGKTYNNCVKKEDVSNWRTELELSEGLGRTVVRQGIKVGGKKGGRAAQGAISSGKTATKNVLTQKTGKGESIGKIAGSLAGGIGGGIAAAPLGGVGAIAGGVAGGEVGERIGGAIGKKFDKKKKITPVKEENLDEFIKFTDAKKRRDALPLNQKDFTKFKPGVNLNLKKDVDIIKNTGGSLKSIGTQKFFDPIKDGAGKIIDYAGDKIADKVGGAVTKAGVAGAAAITGGLLAKRLMSKKSDKEVVIKKESFSNWREDVDYEGKDDSKKIEEAKSPAWQRNAGKSESGGLNAKGVASYRAANPGSKLKTAVTTKPSKLKKGSKAANRRKSFCSRMKGMKKKLTSAKTARDPDSRINKSLRKWNC